MNQTSLRAFEIHGGGDYEVQFYVKKHKARLQGSRTSPKVVKNRRHMYMEKLMGEGEFFSEEDMRKRDPALYEYYVGRHFTQEERGSEGMTTQNTTLSQLLMRSMDSNELAMQVEREAQNNPHKYVDSEEDEAASEVDGSEGDDDDSDGDGDSSDDDSGHRFKPRPAPTLVPQAFEEEFTEEFDDDEEPRPKGTRAVITSYSESDSQAWGAPVERVQWGSLEAEMPSAIGASKKVERRRLSSKSSAGHRPSRQKMHKHPKTMNNEERAQLRLEFLHVMQHRFLEGKEAGFDYKNIDENEDYDDLRQSNRDLEERYFDE